MPHGDRWLRLLLGGDPDEIRRNVERLNEPRYARGVIIASVTGAAALMAGWFAFAAGEYWLFGLLVAAALAISFVWLCIISPRI